MEEKNDETIKKRSMVSIQDTSTPSPNPIKITVDGSFARIVVYDRENLSNEEINQLLNVAKCTKIDFDKHFERKDGIDKHIYTVYNILI